MRRWSKGGARNNVVTQLGPQLDMRGHGDYLLRPIDIAMPPNESDDTINSFFTLPHTCSAVHFLDIYFSSLPYQKKKQKFQTP